MARDLLDRWPTVGFIHLEPYRYSVVTDTPVLDGSGIVRAKYQGIMGSADVDVIVALIEQGG